MAKRNLSKKPKRKQLSRKLKRKTLNRKKGGTKSIARNVAYRGSRFIIGDSEEAEESLKNICFGLILIVAFIIIPAAASAAYTSSGGAPENATFQLPEDLILCINNKTRFNEFMKKVDITNNILTIKDLTADKITNDKIITKLKKDVLLNKYIEVDVSEKDIDNTKISFNLNEIPQPLEEIKTFIGEFIDKIRKLDSNNSLVNIGCINEKVAEIFKNK